MLSSYRDSASSILSKAKAADLSECVLSVDLYINQDLETLTSTLACSCTKKSHEKFLESLPPDTLSEIIPDFSLVPGSICPELTVLSLPSNTPTKLVWEKPYYCLVVWGSWSPHCKKLLTSLEEISQNSESIEIISISLDHNTETISPSIQSFRAEGFAGISEQGFEISEIPCFFLLKQGRIHKKLDLTNDIHQEIADLLQGKPLKIDLSIGNNCAFLSLNSGRLDLNDEFWHLLLFRSSESDYFLRHLTQIQDENPEWCGQLRVTVVEKCDEECIELLVNPGVFFIVHKGQVLLKWDTSCTDIYHMLKNLINPSSLSKEDFLEKKSRFEYSQSQWEQQYPYCPVPKVTYTFSRKFLANCESHEERVVRLEGSFLTVHKEYIEEFFETLLSFFAGAVNAARYEAPSHTISPGEQCSTCDELLEKTHYLCVYCKPAQYFCEKCFHSHPLFRFTPDVLELDHLTWGAFNLNIGKIEGGVHLDVLCNICKEKLSGVRWKCAVCSDFDVCTECLKENKRHPKCHIMIRITS